MWSGHEQHTYQWNEFVVIVFFFEEEHQNEKKWKYVAVKHTYTQRRMCCYGWNSGDNVATQKHNIRDATSE